MEKLTSMYKIFLMNLLLKVRLKFLKVSLKKNNVACVTWIWQKSKVDRD